MSQCTKILNLLKSKDWTCTSEMYASYISDPRTRINEIKKSGIDLEWRWCESHSHAGKMKEWKLTPTMPPQKTNKLSDSAPYPQNAPQGNLEAKKPYATEGIGFDEGGKFCLVCRSYFKPTLSPDFFTCRCGAKKITH